MKKNKKMFVSLIVAFIVTMSFVTTALTATYTIDWDFGDNVNYLHGTNRFTMTDSSKINNGKFTTALGDPFAIGFYNNDDGHYHMRKYGSGSISAGSYFCEEGLISFAAHIWERYRINITGSYTF